MPELYITRAQPNPRGRDRGAAQLNEEWIEFRADASRSLSGDEIIHNTYTSTCQPTSAETLYKFGAVSVAPGQLVRVHTGNGTNGWVGNTYHAYMGYSWFKWNNACGDVVTLAFNGRTLDSAAYRPNPREGELVRQLGTNTLT